MGPDRVQYAATDRYSFKACITDNDTGQTSVLNPTELKAFENSEQGTQGKVYEVMLNELAPGSYTFGIYIALTSDRLMARSSFRVVPVREEGTVRITYNHRRDEFDTVFSPERMFDFRVEGCFRLPKVRLRWTAKDSATRATATSSFRHCLTARIFSA